MTSNVFNKMLIAIMLVSLAGCAEFERREVFGFPYNQELECWETMQPTGKFTRQSVCSNAIWFVREKNGQIWMLGDDCGKDEFEAIDLDNPLQDTLSHASSCKESGE